MNTVCISGRIGAIDERTTATGKRVGRVSIAHSAGRDRTDWHRIDCWEGPALEGALRAGVGALVGIEGRLEIVKLPPRDGEEHGRSWTQIVAHRITIYAWPPRDAGHREGAERRDPVGRTGQEGQAPPQNGGGDDGIPF